MNEEIIEFVALVEDPITHKTYKLAAPNEEELNKKVDAFLESIYPDPTKTTDN